jgi:subfamily B ATP-binding cassette protein MsbA
VEQADRIIVLDGGDIIETGTHAELLNKDGIYAQLHRMQFKV